MSTFTSREEVFNQYISSDATAWAKFIGQYAVEGKSCNTPLYYLSLDPCLENEFFIDKTFEDYLASQGDCYLQEVLTITLPERLLVSTNVQGCWNQMFARIWNCFSGEAGLNRPIDLYLYEVDLTNTVIVDNETLVRNNHLHNAFTNDTYAVFGLPKLKLIKHMSVENTLNYPDEHCTYYHPFNDCRYEPRLLSTPLIIMNETWRQK